MVDVGGMTPAGTEGAAAHGEGLMVLGAPEVERALAGREAEVLDAVRAAYVAHGRGQTSLPHSIFLRFPENEVDRIIGLPAYIGDGFEMSGIKWIASYPRNLDRGLPRASAVMILNSTATGRPLAVVEGSIISARRTAASAALGARELVSGVPGVAGFVGTGLINREIYRFLRTIFPELRRLVVFDLDPARARSFGEALRRQHGEDLEVDVAASLDDLLGRCPLVSFATTAVHPHVDDLAACPPGATLLHVSLRDLSPRAILGADNVVDDPDHVLRARTSVHLAEQETGRRDFIRCTLPEILEGTAPSKRDADAVTVFSPFGLGILDLAVAGLVLGRAREEDLGVSVPSFLEGV